MRRTGHRDHLVTPEHLLEELASELTAQVVLEEERKTERQDDVLHERHDLFFRPAILMGEAQHEAGPFILDPEHAPPGTHGDEVRRVGHLGRRELVPAHVGSFHSPLRISPFIEHLVDLAPGNHPAEEGVDRVGSPRSFLRPVERSDLPLHRRSQFSLGCLGPGLLSAGLVFPTVLSRPAVPQILAHAFHRLSLVESLLVLPKSHLLVLLRVPSSGVAGVLVRRIVFFLAVPRCLSRSFPSELPPGA